MHRLRLTVFAILLPLLLVACAPQAAPTPTAPPAATAAPAKPAPAPTIAPTAVPTPAPTAAPTAAPTIAAAQATPSPAASPSAAAATESTVMVTKDAKLGPMLTDSKGMTLYRYTKDQPDQSSCYDQCAVNWPPIILTAGQPMAPMGLSGSLGLITRKDGSMQLTYNKLPLYYWIKDGKAGDTTGQNVGNVWFVVKPGEMAAQAGAAPAPATTTIMTTNDPKLGTILVDAKGMTLYRYTKDEMNVSNCYDQCATNWPPLLVTSGQPALPAGVAGNLGTITRKDGAKQVTYNGMPLYYCVKDAKSGDTTGQGVGSVWYVVQPGAGAQAGASNSSASGSSNRSYGSSYGSGGY